MLVDSHCHLDFPPFVDDLEGVISRAEKAGVRTLLTIGVEMSRLEGNLAVAERYPNVWATVGVHPTEASQEPTIDTKTLVAFSRHPKVVGFGETGLDYFHKRSSKEEQERAFRAHIHAAQETGLPISIHTRDAIHDTAEILKEEYKNAPYTAVFHCFSGSPMLAEVGLEFGFFFSIAGIVTFPNAKQVKETLADLPLNRLLVETDAPYLTPVPFRGKRNEPAYVVHTAEEIARIKEVPLTEFARATTDNFFRLFPKCQRPE